VNRRLWLGAVVLSTWFLGCGKVEMNYVLNEETKKELVDRPAELDELATALDEVFGTPEAPKIPKAIAPAIEAKLIVSSDEQLASVGAVKYRQWCMHCHGLTGDGNGPTAGPATRPFLNPRPRDYRIGTFKFTSTEGAVSILKPTRADLLRTLRNGVPGTSMPSFALYDQSELDAVLDYVLLLSIRGESELKAARNGDKITKKLVEEEAEGVAESWVSAASRVVHPTKPRPAATPASLARGKELFDSKGECVKCHGPKGLGDGWELDKTTDPAKQIDAWGFRARPANLTLGVFRGGSRPIDLFRRLQHGVKGTPMAAQKINIPDDEDIWHVVNYVRALAYGDIDASLAESPAANHDSTKKN
jgi:mono/diheme cytochrome c family protein